MPATASDEPRGPRGGPHDGPRLRPDRVVPVPAVAREHREAPALGLEEVEGAAPLRRPTRPASESRGEVGRVDRARDHVDVGVPRRIRVGVAGQVREPRGRDGVDRAGEPLEGRPERPLPAPVGRVRALGAPAGDAVVAAPRRPLADPRRPGAGPAAASASDVGDRHDVEAAIGTARAVGVHQPLEEQVAELLVVAVQLAIGRDQGQRRRRRRRAGPASGAAARRARGRSDRRPTSPRARTRRRADRPPS